MVAGQRGGADFQPDGRCRDRRNLACTGMAVDPASTRSLKDGRKVTKKLFREVLSEELQRIKSEVGDARFSNGKYREWRANCSTRSRRRELRRVFDLARHTGGLLDSEHVLLSDQYVHDAKSRYRRQTDSGRQI